RPARTQSLSRARTRGSVFPSARRERRLKRLPPRRDRRRGRLRRSLRLVPSTGRIAGEPHLPPPVVPACRAYSVREARRMALRTGVVRGRLDLVLRATLVAARTRLLLFGDCHRARKDSGG